MLVVDLPLDILWEIWVHIDCASRDWNALVRTCRLLHDTFNTELYRYVLYRNKRLVKRLLSEVAVRGEEDSVRSLMAHGASPCMNEDSILERQSDFDEHCCDFIRHGMYSTERRNWKLSVPLVCATWAGHLGIVKMLVSAGANVNAHTMFGGLPIIWAVLADQPEIICFLVESGAVTDFQMERVYSLLGLAVEAVGDNTLQTLLAATEPGSQNPFCPTTGGFDWAFRHAMKLRKLSHIRITWDNAKCQRPVILRKDFPRMCNLESVDTAGQPYCQPWRHPSTPSTRRAPTLSSFNCRREWFNI